MSIVTDRLHASPARPGRAASSPDDPVAPETRALQSRAHELIPGGAHTYAKGDDQYPRIAPPFIDRGDGCRVWDRDGREFIEYGMGLRSVLLGHGHPEVVDAAHAAMARGTNFTRPTALEVECAELLLSFVGGADMVKFAKNGSDTTTAAVKLARAWTGRDLVGVCADHSFFSVDDWFIGTTPMRAGIPDAVRELTVRFHYNDLESVRTLLERHPDGIACLILEPATAVEPEPGFLEGLRKVCDDFGVALIFDEMITGLRWGLGGAQAVYGVTPDLATFGKALANGFSVAALTGRREIMELGGLARHPEDRVFLLSTTHGAESHALAAAAATLEICRREGVPELLRDRGERLRAGVQSAIDGHGLDPYVEVVGHPANLLYVTRDPSGQPSQPYRTLFMQELIRNGILGPSFVVSAAHSEEEIDRTIEATDAALDIYARALQDGVEPYLVGPPTQRVFATRSDSR